MRQENNVPGVQIQEPALKEIKKHHGCLTGSFLTGGGCIIIFIGAIYLLARLIVGSGPTQILTFPPDWPKEIPQINPDKIIKITSIDARTKTRAVWIATAIPRFLLAPTLNELDPDTTITEQTDSLGRVSFQKDLTSNGYLHYLNWSVGADNTKTIIVNWNGITSYPSLIAEQLANQLQKKNYTINLSPTTDNSAGFSFAKEKISGTFRAVDLKPNQAGTEFAELVVNYP